MNKKYLVIDCRLSKKCCDYLINIGYSLIKIPCCKYIEAPVSAHPDMSVFKCKSHLFVSNDVEHLFCFDKNKIVIDRGAHEDTILKYPFDVAMNCALLGNNLICSKKNVHKQIMDFAIHHGLQIIDVKQGYSKCSVCIVSDNAIITEDMGIATACTNYGIDVLLLQTRAVNLKGYNYGFIGGSSGTLSDGKIVFAGDIVKHPEFDKIQSFCNKYGKSPISMSDEPLYDVGSIIEI